MPAWILLVILTTNSVGPVGSNVEQTSVTTVPFATQAACESARITIVSGVRSNCFRTGYQ